MRIVGLVPARGGSKGIPRKNLKLVGGNSLLSIKIEQAKLSQCNEIWVSTEDPEIASIAKQDGANIIERPMALAEDDTSTDDMLIHAAETLKLDSSDCIVLLQPTSPFRSKEDFDSLRLLIEGADSVISAKLFDSPHPEKRIKSDRRGFLIETETNTGRLSTPRQKLEEFLVFDGAFYLTKCSVVFNETKLIGNKR